jgi:hypothetical protein
MTGARLDGVAVAAQVEAELRSRVAALGRPPGLAVVLVGSDPASSQVYVSRKGVRSPERVGLHCIGRSICPPTTTQRAACVEVVAEPSTPTRPSTASWCSSRCRGTSTRTWCSTRSHPEKDVDGFTHRQQRAAHPGAARARRVHAQGRDAADRGEWAFQPDGQGTPWCIGRSQHRRAADGDAAEHAARRSPSATAARPMCPGGAVRRSDVVVAAVGNPRAGPRRLDQAGRGRDRRRHEPGDRAAEGKLLGRRRVRRGRRRRARSRRSRRGRPHDDRDADGEHRARPPSGARAERSAASARARRPASRARLTPTRPART